MAYDSLNYEIQGPITQSNDRSYDKLFQVYVLSVVWIHET